MTGGDATPDNGTDPNRVTLLLGQVFWLATRENTREHVADPYDYRRPRPLEPDHDHLRGQPPTITQTTNTGAEVIAIVNGLSLVHRTERLAAATRRIPRSGCTTSPETRYDGLRARRRSTESVNLWAGMKA